MYIIPYIQISELYFDRLLRKLTCLSEFSKVKWFWFCEILKKISPLFNLLTTHRISVAAMIVIFNGKMC